MALLITIIDTTISVLTIFIFIYSMLSFVLGPDHPIRQTMGQVIEPMLAPIKKLVPSYKGLDFSPLILMVVFQVIGAVLIAIIRAMG